MYPICALLAQASAAANHSPSGVFSTYVLAFSMIVGAIVAGFFWLWMLAACLMSDRPTPQKVGWALVIFFLNFIGAVLYYFAARGAKSTI